MAATSTNNLRQGSSGERVIDLQKLLNQNGYSLNVDGSFGPKTEAAVRSYQQANGLTVDGIVGPNTYGALTSNTTTTTTGTNTGTNNTNTGTGTNNTNTSTGTGTNNANDSSGSGGNTITTASGYTYQTPTIEGYQATATEQQAWDTLGQLQANTPGEWVDPYKDKYMGYLDQYENRDPFSYDFNSDALYQQYKDQYIQQGQMAMMDTMGQAAAMTGGYGNSYAQTVGQQAYNQQLNQLNEIMPELYDRAYGIYQQEGQDLLNMYNAYLGLSESDYNKYLGSVDNYYKELGAAQDYATLLYNKGYGEWSDKTQMDLDIWNTNTQLGYNDHAMIQNQNYQSNENQLDRDFQAGQNQLDRDFQAGENEKSRNFTAGENDKDRAANDKANAKNDLINLITSTGYNPTEAELTAAGMTRAQANAYTKVYDDAQTVAAAVPYGTLNTEDTMTWIKKFEGAESIEKLDEYTTALQGVIGPAAAAIWHDTYVKKFEDEDRGSLGIIGSAFSGFASTIGDILRKGATK